LTVDREGEPVPGFRLEDLGSGNGVAINGRRLQKGESAAVVNRDVVNLGDVALLFLDVEGLFEHLPELVA
jgi:pSer/pThr/pTyr-binding forkhead associated (FHA) protein